MDDYQVWVGILSINEPNSTFNSKIYVHRPNSDLEDYKFREECPNTVIWGEHNMIATEFYKTPGDKLGMSIIGDTSFDFSLKNYPGDTQNLMIELAELPEGSNITLENVDLGNGIRSRWSIVRTYVEESKISIKFVENGVDDYKGKSNYKINVLVKRKPQPFIVNVYLPLVLVMLYCFTSGFLPTSDLSGKISICGTALLTFLAYIVIVSTMIPQKPGTSNFQIFTMINVLSIIIITIIAKVFENEDGHHENIALVVLLSINMSSTLLMLITLLS
jgi:hypothetical protein